MTDSTDINVSSNFYSDNKTTLKIQVNDKKFEPVLISSDLPNLTDNALSLKQVEQKSFEPPIASLWSPTTADTAPLQIWEGTVKSVDRLSNEMHVILEAKIGEIPRHTAEISLEWVSEQDEDLVCTGAVFYLTLYKRTKRGSIINSQELRFRRRPSWTIKQLENIKENAASIHSKMVALPLAE